jgi:HD-GYP domain-containing protein (c-di-GMP phosphodiesterase class II)
MKLPVSHLVPGMKLARAVYGLKGQMLLREGVELTSSYISALKKYNVLAVMIESVAGFDIEMSDELLEEKSRAEAMLAVEKWIESNKKQREFGNIFERVGALVSEILEGKVPAGGLAEISSADTYTFAHSIDVCTFALFMGFNAGYKKDKLLELGMGTIMHDLGKVKVPPEILHKPAKLTVDEFKKIKNHPIWGYNMLAEAITAQMSEATLDIVLCHHEKYNGTGYPHGLKGEEISDFATLCAIADIYSAMTTDRIYSKAAPPNEVYEMIIACGNIDFKFPAVKLFSKCVYPYPIDTLVLLSTGSLGCVISTNRNLPFRPIVKMLETGEILDLAKELSVVISRTLTDDEAQMAAIKYADSRNVSTFYIPGVEKSL